MEMPRPGDAHALLERFVGRWEGEETLFPSPWSPEQRAAIGRFEYRMAVDGFFLLSDYEERQGDAVTYQGHGVYGFDGRAGRYTMHWFDSMGGAYEKPAEGGWEGDTLAFRNETPQGHARYVHSFPAEGVYTFRLEVSRDGAQWTPFMEGRYRRA